MGSMKSAGALIAALVPIAYCGAMLFYFFNVGGGSVQGVAAIGLGPTVLGIGALGLLFMVPLIIKLIRLTTVPPASGPKPRLAAHTPVEEEAFDADAALARYLARKAVIGDDPQVGTIEPDNAPAVRPAFGRKIA
jgi:hypothetical protein